MFAKEVDGMNSIIVGKEKSPRTLVTRALFLCTLQDSNLRPFGPEPNALSPELRVHKLYCIFYMD